MAKVKLSSGYTKQGKLFENWHNKRASICPDCGRGYIRKVNTGVSTIYAHIFGDVCEVRYESGP